MAITKKLIHDLVTFTNNYIDNPNIVIGISCYSNRYVVSRIEVWSLKYSYINKHIGSISCHIHNEKEFIKYKQNVLEKLPKLLEQLNNKINDM